ncbi:MAG: hypothetical protein R3220_12850, partial [Balneolaceae bacterium]|nr:hypothetical protein [Balneolaceae bacterium]
MSRILRRIAFTALFLLTINPALTAAVASQDEPVSEEETEEVQSENPIDVIGKVQDHYYLDVAGYHLYLPRIVFV